MEERDQLILDLYKKYAGKDLDNEGLNKVKSLYSPEESHQLIRDIYKKFKGKDLPEETVQQVLGLYNLSVPEAGEQYTQQPETEDPSFWESVSAAWTRGMGLSEQAENLTFDSQATEGGIEEVAQLQKQMRELPQSAAYSRFTQAKTFGESLKEFTKHPLQITSELLAESTATMVGNWEYAAGKAAMGGAGGAAVGSVVPGIGTAVGAGVGASAGAIVGMAEGSLRTEYAAKYLEVLEEAGVDTTDPESIKSAFEDDEIMGRARELAFKKAIPIAVFDLLSGGLAGRMVTKPAKSLAGKLGQGAAELGMQAGLGGAGEAAGQIVAGEEIQPGAIMAEMIGEGPTAIVETATGAAGRQQPNDGITPVAPTGDLGISTGDPTIDDATTDIYEEAAQRLDAMEGLSVTEGMTVEEYESALAERGIYDFTPPGINEENELPDVEYTPEEARAIQVAGPKPISATDEYLDDADRTPAIAAQVARNDRGQSTISDENELEKTVYTPEEIREQQVSKNLSDTRNTEEKLDDSVATPNTPYTDGNLSVGAPQELPSGNMGRPYQFKEEGVGDADGWIVGNKASLLNIFAEKDEQGNAKRGGNLYGKVIDALERQGITQFTVGMQSESSTKALQKKIAEGRIKPVNVKKETDNHGQPIRFDIVPKDKMKPIAPKATPVAKPVAKPSTSIPKTTKTKQPKADKPVAPIPSEESKPVKVKKPSITEQEKSEHLRVKYTKMIENIKKDKPGKRMKRFDSLMDKLEDFPDLQQQVQKEMNRTEAIADDRAFEREAKNATPQERVSLIRERNADESLDAPLSVIEQMTTRDPATLSDADLKDLDDAYASLGRGLIAQEDAQLRGIIDNIRRERNRALRKKPETPQEAAEREAAIRESVSSRQAKDDHLTSIARGIIENNKAALDRAIKSYTKWRKDQGLKPLSEDSIIKSADKEFYHKRAEQQRRNDDARTKRNNSIKRQLGLSSKAEVREVKGTRSRLQDGFHKSQLEQDVIFNDVRTVTADQVFKVLGPRLKDKHVKAISNLFNLANRVTKKLFGKNIEIILADAKGAPWDGLAINDATTRRRAIIINTAHTSGIKTSTDQAIIDSGSVLTHEMIHQIMVAVVDSFAYVSGIRSHMEAWEGVMTTVEYTRRAVENDVRKMILNIHRKAVKDIQLTKRERAFAIAYANYTRMSLEAFGDKTHIDRLLGDLDGDKTLNYFLFNHQELLAETFSNPDVMTMLSLLKDDVTFSRTPGKSYFKEIAEAFSEFIEKLARYVGLDRRNSGVSYLDNLLETVAEFEQSLNEDVVSEIESDNSFIGEHLNELASEQLLLDALYSPEESLRKLEEALSATNDPVSGNPMQAKRRGKPNNTSTGNTPNWKVLNRQTGELRKLLKDIALRWYKRDDLNNLDQIFQELEKINAKTTKNKLGMAEAMYIRNRMNKLRNDIANAKALQAEMNDNFQEVVDMAAPVIDGRPSKTFVKDFTDFLNVDIDRLTPAEAVIYFEGLFAMAVGGSPSYRSMTLLNKVNAVKKLEALLDQTGKYAKDPGIYPLLPTKISIASLTNPATYSSIMAKYNTDAANTLFTEIFGNLVNARSWTVMESISFQDSLYDTVKKHKLSFTDMIRTGMYGAIFSTQLSPSHADYWAEVQANADRVLQNTKNKMQALEEGTFGNDGVYARLMGRRDREKVQKEIDIATDLRRMVHNQRSMDGILSAGQQELYNKFRKFASEHEQDIKRNTESVWGAEFTQQHNYMPTFAMGRLRTTSIKGDQLIPNSQSNNLWDALQNNVNYGQVVARQSGQVKEKVQPEGYYYDYDILSMAHKFAPSVLFDIYASRELKTLNQLINGTNRKPVSSNGKDIGSLFVPKALDGLNIQLKAIVGSAQLYDRELSRALKVINRFKNNYAMAVLGTTGQLLVQGSSAVPAAMIMNPKTFPKALQLVSGIEMGTANTSKLQEALKMAEREGALIVARDALFERMQTIEDHHKEGIGKVTSNWKATAQQLTTAALRGGDKFAARLVWFSEFFANGGTLENPTREAIMAAERQVGVLQNMSDIAFSSPLFRTNNEAARILMHMFYAFKSFALNNGLNTLYSIKYGLTTNNREARQVAVSSILMAAAYHFVTMYIIRPLYSSAAGMVGEALFGESGSGEEDEDKNYTRGEEFLYATMWDILIGQYAPDVASNALKYGIFQGIKAHKESEGGKYDAHKDFPLYVHKNIEDAFGEGLGVYGDAAIAATDLAASTMVAMWKMHEGEELEFDELTLDGIRAMFLFWNAIPFRGDAQKLLRNYQQRLKREKRIYGRSGNSGTDFEVPDSSIDIDMYIPDNPVFLPEIENY